MPAIGYLAAMFRRQFNVCPSLPFSWQLSRRAQHPWALFSHPHFLSPTRVDDTYSRAHSPRVHPSFHSPPRTPYPQPPRLRPLPSQRPNLTTDPLPPPKPQNMDDRRESNVFSSTAPVSIAPSGPGPSTTAQIYPPQHASSLQRDAGGGRAPPSYTKPNMNALGKNREDTYFSSVKWGGTPGGNIQNFTKTVSG